MPHRDTHSDHAPRSLTPLGTPLGWVASRCLQAPPHPLACRLCLDACPAEALGFHEADDDSVALLASDACHGCGQCVPACPSEALVSAEVEALREGQAEGEPLRLGCHRVAESVEPMRLHCLRALGPDLLAEMAARAMPGVVTLTLPEGCRDCAAAPAHVSDAWRRDAEALVTVSEVPAASDYRAARPAVSRRDLLRGRAAPRLPAVPADDATPGARRLERQRAAAAALGAPHSAPPLPGLILDLDACRAHGVCTRVCPTAALQETPEGELVFDPLACLDCGHCLTACPEGALTTGTSTGPKAVTLRSTRRIACFQCGRPFAPPGSNSPGDGNPTRARCPACRREAALMQESFDDLFG